MPPNHHLNKPQGGVEGYKRLVRLVVRAFYSGECPPPEPEDEQPAFRKRGDKHSFPGLGILVVDLLASVDGYVDEDEICRHLRLSQKNVRKALRHLEGEHLLAFQDVKFKRPRQPKGEAPAGGAAKQAPKAEQKPEQQQQQQAAAAGAKQEPAAGAKKGAKGAAAGGDGDEEDEVPMRKETKVFWCVDYPRLKDSLRLRLHRVREFIKEQVQDRNPLQDYLCLTCGARYSSLDAIRLLDPMQGVFRCEDCRGELVQHVEGGKSVGEDRKATVAKYRELQARLEAQLKPVVDQLERLKDIDPPDYGSLQDWFAEQQAARARQAKRDAAAAAKAAAAAAGGEVAPIEWVDNAEVQVNFGGGPGAAAAAAEPGKELPAWFRTGQASGLASNATNTSETTAEPSTATDAAAALVTDADRERQREIQEAYLAQYLADVARAKAAGATDGGFDDKKDVKRIKTEAGWAAAEVKPELEPKLEPAPAAALGLPAAAAEAGGGWEQVQQEPLPPQQQQPPPQQQQELLDDEFGQWEDVAGQGEGVGARAAGAAGAVDDEFEWEDA